MESSADNQDSIIKQILDFEIFDGDCIITGYPKSGSTWLQEIVWMILQGGDPDLCNHIPNYIRVPYLETAASLDFLELQPRPRVFKTHLPFHLLPRQVRTKKCRLVHVLRNPKDVAVSMWQFCQDFNMAEDHVPHTWTHFVDLFLESHDGWFDHVLGWWRQRRRENVLLVQYEEMQKDTRKQVVQLGQFLGRALNAEEVDKILHHTSFQNMKNNPVLNMCELHENELDQRPVSKFMRKGCVGDWKNYLTLDESERFNQKYRERLGKFGLDFRFE